MSQSEPPARFQITPNYVLTAVLSWLVPGAGYWLLGYRWRGVIIAVVLLGIFWSGESLLAENKAVTRKVHPYYFAMQAGNGASAFVADRLYGEPSTAEGNLQEISRDLPPHLNLGILFCTISGLLNALVVVHVLDPQTWTGDRKADDEGEDSGR